MKGSIEIVHGSVNTKITVKVEEDPIESDVAAASCLGILVPNEQWEHLIFQEAARIGFNPQIPTT